MMENYGCIWLISWISWIWKCFYIFGYVWKFVNNFLYYWNFFVLFSCLGFENVFCRNLIIKGIFFVLILWGIIGEIMYFVVFFLKDFSVGEVGCSV